MSCARTSCCSHARLHTSGGVAPSTGAPGLGREDRPAATPTNGSHTHGHSHGHARGPPPPYLYGGVASFQEGDGQEDALVEHAVAGRVHYEVDDQVGGPLLVQVALDLGQAHLAAAHGAGPGAAPWGEGTWFYRHVGAAVPRLPASTLTPGAAEDRGALTRLRMPTCRCGDGT